mgnify:CR=1 FL=1
MPERYPAITIWQPWATLIAEGIKPFEFRSWPAPRRLVGKRIAIHAGARPVRRVEIRDLIHRLEIDGAHGQAMQVGPALTLLERVWADLGMLPLSSILCLATLGEPLSPEQVGRQLANDSDRSGHFNWAWPLSAIERLEPFVPARGSQGWWTWERVEA